MGILWEYEIDISAYHIFIHGGMIGNDGGLLGAGMARIPMECFEKALVAFAEKYGVK